MTVVRELSCLAPSRGAVSDMLYVLDTGLWISDGFIRILGFRTICLPGGHYLACLGLPCCGCGSRCGAFVVVLLTLLEPQYRLWGQTSIISSSLSPKTGLRS